jgi:hypothetical protein
MPFEEGSQRMLDPDKERLIASLDTRHAVWQRSSIGSNGSSVEIAFLGEAILMRDGSDPGGAVLHFTRAEWDAFVQGAKDGEFDLS